MAVPHRHDVAACIPPSPYDHNHPVIEKTCADPANFAVVKPVINNRHRVARKTLLGVNREIKTPVRQGPIALGVIEGCRHTCLCNGMITPLSRIV
jgi:hypothetical protein